MRKIIVGLTAFALIAAGCAKSTTTPGSGAPATRTSASTVGTQTAAECAQSANLLTSGKVTIGTSNPAYAPYFQGGAAKGSDWKNNDPSNDKGFESAVGYEIANRLGFDHSSVTWVVEPFTKSYAPGPKDFDFDLNQISYKPGRAQAVDFSDGYYDVNQAIVAVKGTPITQATTVADLKPYTLAAPLGTTSYDLITNVIQPANQPGVYQQLSDTVAALNAGQVDGIVVDYPTALYIADPYVQQVKNSVVVGQFETPAGAQPEHFGAVLAKGSTLTPCINLALNEMRGDGTLDAITTKWLSEKTNVGPVPVFGP